MKDYEWGMEEEPGEVVKKIASPKENKDTDDFNVVEYVNNTIYFYSGVTRPKVLKLNKSIVTLANNIRIKSILQGTEASTHIKLHINSYGGSVFAGLAAYDYIASSKVPVETVIDGCAASAATLMSVAASHRSMHANACMLVHQLSGHMWGKFQAMEDDMENSKMLMEKIKSIYRKHTKIPEDKINEILKRDLWWDAEQCLEYGLVDEII